MMQKYNRFQLPALSACAFVLVALTAAAIAGADRETIVIVVRHAEKAVDGTDDPPLSDAGRRRAAALAHAVTVAGIKAIFATEYQRTQQTVEPVSRSLNLPVTRLAASKADQFAREVLDNHRGETVMIAGHSNTIPDIIAAFGAPKIDPWTSADMTISLLYSSPRAVPPDSSI